MKAIEAAEREVRKLADKHREKGTFFNIWGNQEEKKPAIGDFAAEDGAIKPWVVYTLADGVPVKADRFKYNKEAKAFGKRQREHYKLPSGMKAKITTNTVQASSWKSKVHAKKMEALKERGFKAKEPAKEQLGMKL